MKFTKEEAVEKLNQLLTNDGKKPLRMSAKTLNEHAESLMSLVADEEMELDDFVTKVKPMLENVNSNMEKDRSDFIKEYQKTHPEPPKPKKKTEEGEGEGKEPTLLEQIQQQLNELKEQNRQREETEAVEAKRKEVRKYLETNHVTDAKWIDSILEIATIGKDDDAEEKGKTYLELYNQSRSGGGPITPKTPRGGGSDEDPFAELRALRKQEMGDEQK